MALISFCCTAAPWLPLPALLDHAAGYDGVELIAHRRHFDPGQPPGFWNNNATWIPSDRLTSASAAIADDLAARGLRCAMLSTYFPVEAAADLRAAAAAARTLGCRLVRAAMPAPDADSHGQFLRLRTAWRELSRMAAGEDVRLVLELHNHTATPSASAALRLLDGLDPASVGIVWDVANTCGEGNEAIPFALGLLGPYLAHVHVKQLRYRVADESDQRLSRLAVDFAPVIDPGHVPWREISQAIASAGYDGWWSLEDFTRIERGPARLAEDLAWARATLPAS